MWSKFNRRKSRPIFSPYLRRYSDRPRLGRASKAFQRWIDQLPLGLKEALIPALEKAGMVDSEVFKDRLGIEPSTPILEVADFNSLIALSQEFQVPVYALTRSKPHKREPCGTRPRKA
jgi:hypothetical protein